ncbi:MAG TPA: YciI family protein [Bacteroidota bacterium]|nr:YciI family protein [Bacteroidota bacterium]
MNYLCLAYEQEHASGAPSQLEGDLPGRETASYILELKMRGHLISADIFPRSSGAAIVRVRSGKVTVGETLLADDGGYLGGFFLITARDLNEAIQLASKWPSARFGSVVVRPVREVANAEDPLPPAND